MREEFQKRGFSSEAEEAAWWDSHQDELGAEFQQAAEEGTLGRGTAKAKMEPMPELLAALRRADTLLVAVQAFIADNDLEEFAVEYDEATCDGSCLRDDANFAVGEIRAAIDKAEGRA